MLKTKAIQILRENLKEERMVTQVLGNNYVYITNDEKEPFLVKFVPKNDKNRLDVELAINDFICGNINIKVPKIIDIGEYEDKVYVLREKIIGASLEQYQQKNKNVQDLYFQSGQVLAKLHSFEFKKRGIFNPDLSIKKYDLFDQNEYHSFIVILFSKGALTKQQFSTLKQVDVERYFSYKRNVFCHSDFNPKNILVKDEKIVSIIDFEWACSAPFMDDLATFDLFAELEGFGDQVQFFYDGYNSVKAIDDFYFKGIHFYKFYRLITMLSFQLSASDDRFIGEFQQKLTDKLTEQLMNISQF